MIGRRTIVIGSCKSFGELHHDRFQPNAAVAWGQLALAEMLKGIDCTGNGGQRLVCTNKTIFAPRLDSIAGEFYSLISRMIPFYLSVIVTTSLRHSYWSDRISYYSSLFMLHRLCRSPLPAFVTINVRSVHVSVASIERTCRSWMWVIKGDSAWGWIYSLGKKVSRQDSVLSRVIVGHSLGGRCGANIEMLGTLWKSLQ